eukprot:3521850-Rhodomonas_salina.1
MTALCTQLKYKKPHFQYKIYQKCGFLYLSLHCDAVFSSLCSFAPREPLIGSLRGAGTVEVWSRERAVGTRRGGQGAGVQVEAFSGGGHKPGTDRTGSRYMMLACENSLRLTQCRPTVRLSLREPEEGN